MSTTSTNDRARRRHLTARRERERFDGERGVRRVVCGARDANDGGGDARDGALTWLGRAPTRRARVVVRAAGPAARKELLEIESREAFDALVGEDRVTVVDFMALWCRKCVFLKGKLEKKASFFGDDVRFAFVDVNKVSQELVRGCGVESMPTLQVYRNGEKLWELVAGEDGEAVVKKLHYAIEDAQKEK